MPTEQTTTCDINVLLARSKCFQRACLGEIDLNSIEILARVKNLAASGGSDYTTNLNALLQDAKQYQVIPKDQRRQINVVLSIDNAIDDGASMSYDPNVLKSQAKCYECLGIELQLQLLLFLRCSLAKLDKPD
jgi:hypothetical protein